MARYSLCTGWPQIYSDLPFPACVLRLQARTPQPANTNFSKGTKWTNVKLGAPMAYSLNKEHQESFMRPGSPCRIVTGGLRLQGRTQPHARHSNRGGKAKEATHRTNGSKLCSMECWFYKTARRQGSGMQVPCPATIPDTALWLLKCLNY